MPKGIRPLVRRLSKPIVLQGAEMAELLMVQASRITQLVTEGALKRIGKGQYDLKDTVQAYIRHLREVQKRQQVQTADNRIRDARAKDIEARTAQRLGQLVSLALYDEMIDGFAGIVRSEFAGMPAACTRDLVMRRIIERETNARLHRIAEYAMAQSIRVEAIRGADAPERSNGAGRLGRSKSDLPADGGDSGAS
jgi:predicted HTH domain antitoxin